MSDTSVRLSKILSTMNNNCGITGKARLTANASLSLITRYGLGVVNSPSVDKSAPDVTLADCAPVSPCGTEIVDDGSCNDGSTGGPSAGGGGGSDGGSCEEWAAIEYTSYDGGATWEYDGVLYYYWVC